jgi:hypothetical protein
MKINHTKLLIKNVMQEDYSKARESLQCIVNEKIEKRIATHLKDLKEKSK